MNKLRMSIKEIDEYIEKCKKSIQKETEVKEAIERRGEIYKGELKNSLANLKSLNEMLKLLEGNKC